MPVGLRFLSAGYVIEEKYSIVQAIGSGGMGIVYEATHTRLGRRVAVKVLQADLAQQHDAVARFEREARAAAQLRSEHVARVFDVGALPDETPYIVMEYLEGCDLAAEMAERGPLPVQRAIDYLLQACDAMTEAHRLGIVHRDLKPANLFLASGGRDVIVKVLDFGISKIIDGAVPSVTTTRTGLGTAAYMSPEQIQSAKHVDARTDVWALGVVLYEMLSGRHPFAGETTRTIATAIIADEPVPVRRVREDVPRELEQVITKALEKNRERRFRDAAEFAFAIAPFGSEHAKRGSAHTARNAAPTLKSAPGNEMIDQPRDESLRSPRGTPPRSGEFDRSPRDGARSSRLRSFAVMVALIVAIASSVAVFREMSGESVSPGRPVQQVLAPPLVETSSVAVPTRASTTEPGDVVGEVPPAVEKLAAADQRSPKASGTVSTAKSLAAKSNIASNVGAGASSPPSESSGLKATQHPATTRSPQPSIRKSTLGLPDDPG